MDFRIGLGTDLHRLEMGIPLVIGGVTIPFHKGPRGHSDGDALIHALCDALLGALSLRDIGHHFPDSDPRYKGVASTFFLEKVVSMVREQGWEPLNIDATVHLEEPRLSPFIPSIIESLAMIMNLEAACISVKAKTGEKTGMIGEGMAIEALAICLLGKQTP